MATRRAIAVLALLLASLVAACGSAVPSASPVSGATAVPSPAGASPAASVDRIAGWRSDLASLLPGMDRLHPKLDHGTPRPTLEAAVAALAERVPIASDDELLVGVLRVVAMVSATGCDAHTGAFVWGKGSFPVTSLPLRLWWFDDGVRVVDALAPHGDLVGARLVAIGGHPIDEVLAAVEPLIPRDNDSTIRLLMPRYLLVPEVLRGLDLLGGAGSVTIAVAAPDGSTRDVAIDPIPMADYNAWAGPYGLHLPSDPDVPYLSRIDDALWWTTRDDGPTFFVQENRVARTSASQLEALRVALAATDARHVVLDLRHNYGGEVDGVDPLVDLFTDPAVDRPGRLFVITGRNTFSAASLMVARLAARTDAGIVGEAMGGCPTAYGDAEEIRLPFSGIVVDVPTVLEVGVAADDTRQTIEPDLPAVLTFEAWSAGLDEPLGAIPGIVE